MSWVAFDRAIRLSVDRARPVDLAKWTSARDQVYRAIMDKDWNDSLNAFVQYEGGDVLDAVQPAHAGGGVHCAYGWEVAIDAVGHGPHFGIGQPGVPLRPEGIARWPRGSEGTFSLCTFFYVQVSHANWALAGGASDV